MWSFIPQEWALIFTDRTETDYENKTSRTFRPSGRCNRRLSWQIKSAINSREASNARDHKVPRAARARWDSIIASVARRILIVGRNFIGTNCACMKTKCSEIVADLRKTRHGDTRGNILLRRVWLFPDASFHSHLCSSAFFLQYSVQSINQRVGILSSKNHWRFDLYHIMEGAVRTE